MQQSRMEPTAVEPKTTVEPALTNEPDLTEAEIDVFLARLPKQYTYPKLLLRSSRALYKYVVLVWLYMLLVCLLCHQADLGFMLLSLPLLAVYGFMMYSFVMLLTHRKRTTIMRRLVRRNAPEIVCYCLDVVSMNNVFDVRDWKVSPEAATLLIHYLPLMSEDEMCGFNSNQRHRLNWLLRQKEPQLVTAALHVIALIGDKNAISYVESLIKRTKDPAVRFAAQECLLLVQERAATSTDSSVLLRASQPETHSEELLRAAVPVSETRPQELLLLADPDTQKIVL